MAIMVVLTVWWREKLTTMIGKEWCTDRTVNWSESKLYVSLSKRKETAKVKR